VLLKYLKKCRNPTDFCMPRAFVCAEAISMRCPNTTPAARPGSLQAAPLPARQHAARRIELCLCDPRDEVELIQVGLTADRA
jgi:hypothetical protein